MSEIKELLNIKLEKLTGKQDTTDLTQVSQQMDKERKLAYQLLQRLETAAELKKLEKALYGIDDFIKKGGK